MGSKPILRAEGGGTVRPPSSLKIAKRLEDRQCKKLAILAIFAFREDRQVWNMTIFAFFGEFRRFRGRA